VNATESARIGAYLSKLFASPTMSVRTGAPSEGEVLVAGEAIADIVKDEEDGELSYAISLVVPRAAGMKKGAPIDADERKRLEDVLKQKLHSAGLEVRARPRKTDSAEVYVGEEFIGTISADDEAGYYLTAIVLGFDLED
jgi:hypothetical protein